MDKSRQQFHKFKNFPTKAGGGPQNLGTDPKLYLVINYDGFPLEYLVMLLTAVFLFVVVFVIYDHWVTTGFEVTE